MLTTLTSPTRGEKYTIENLFSKFLERREFEGSYKIVPVHSCYYGSSDFVVKFDLATIESSWTESVMVRLEGVLPLHINSGGKQELEWGSFASFNSYEGSFKSDFSDSPVHQEWVNKLGISLSAWTDKEERWEKETSFSSEGQLPYSREIVLEDFILENTWNLIREHGARCMLTSIGAED